MLHDNRGCRSTGPQITIEDALMAFDNRRDGDPGPAYGTVVLYNARYASLEELTRDVLLDWGMDPDRWQEHTTVIEDAFGVWLNLDAPNVAPVDPGPGVGHAA